MIEILFGILELFLGLVLEAAFDFALELVAALIWRGFTAVLDKTDFENPVVAFIGYSLFGAAVGVISLLFLPHPFVHPSRFHGISLIISPVLGGFGMSCVGWIMRKRNKKVMQLESFGYGFAFALGIALVRFFFTTNVQ